MNIEALGLRRQDDFDYQRVLDFIHAHPADQPHVLDQPYRLTSYSVEDPRNYAGWVDGQGRLRAFGLMQEPFAELDWAVHPDLAGTALPDAVLRWGLARAQALANAAHQPFTFYVWDTPHAHASLRRLAPALAPSERTLMTARLALTPDRLQPPRLPEGFTLRALAGAADEAAYVALQQAAFGTRKMTPDWRQRLGQTAAYDPALNLAVVDAAGELAAASIGWVGPDGAAAQMEPGVTHPRHRRLGLMQAVLQAAFNRLAAGGVRDVYISWIGSNAPVGPLLSGLGFAPHTEYRGWAGRRGPRTLRGLVRALRARLKAR